MRRRIGGPRQNLLCAPVRLVVDALPALVLHDVPLRIQFRDVEGVEQEAHAIGFEPDLVLEIVRRHRFEVRRAIVRRGPVVGPPDSTRQLVVHAIGRVAGPGEHHVLEQVREPGASRQFVLRANVIPDVHGDSRSRVVGRQDDRQTVRQRVRFKRQLDDASLRRTLRRHAADRQDQERQRHPSGEGQHDSRSRTASPDCRRGSSAGAPRRAPRPPVGSAAGRRRCADAAASR